MSQRPISLNAIQCSAIAVCCLQNLSHAECLPRWHVYGPVSDNEHISSFTTHATRNCFSYHLRIDQSHANQNFWLLVAIDRYHIEADTRFSICAISILFVYRVDTTSKTSLPRFFIYLSFTRNGIECGGTSIIRCHRNDIAVVYTPTNVGHA